MTYYVYDLLRLEGPDTREPPLRVRNSLVRRALAYRSPLRLTPHRNAGGGRAAGGRLRPGLGGLIAKRADGVCEPRRSADRLKLTCSLGQEFAVGGFTEPAGSRVGLGAPLLGHYEGGRLRYTVKVGTGFGRRTLLDLRERRGGPRESGRAGAGGGCALGAAELVARIAFTEWTRDGMLRHPRYPGLRDDKKPRNVVRERPSGRTAA
ncbi:hypothetical protein [Streptomyces sp. DG1A-41]|uniref:ATP dependent DNA ligase n=1 Tax=Streptomyces sp. DG1A-41 TaxID=3125779 RepID=UPI0030CC3EF4